MFFSLIVFIVCVIIFFVYNPLLIKPFLLGSLASGENIVLNIVIIIFGISGFFYFIIKPLLHILLPSLSTVGNKLQWSEGIDSQELSDQQISERVVHRYFFTFICILLSYILWVYFGFFELKESSFIPQGFFNPFSYENLGILFGNELNKTYIFIIKTKVNSIPFIDGLKLATFFLASSYILALINTRTKGISRIIIFFRKFYEKTLYKKPMPEFPFERLTKELSICMFSQLEEYPEDNNNYGFLVFHRKRVKKKSEEVSSNIIKFFVYLIYFFILIFSSLFLYALKNIQKTFQRAFIPQKALENWVTLDTKALRANILCVAPTGGGKTTALIRPFAQQVIAWNAENQNLKASIIVFDPKAELTSEIVELATAAGRSQDLVLLKLGDGVTINPIQVMNPWSSETSYKVAGWIVGAYMNFQGQMNSDPYWTNQSLLLTRNLLVLLYCEKDIQVTLADIAQLHGKTGAGCFSPQNTPLKTLNIFGFKVLTTKIGVMLPQNPQWDSLNSFLEFYEILDQYYYEPLSPEILNTEIKSFAEAMLKARQEAFYQKVLKKIMIEYPSYAYLCESILNKEYSLQELYNYTNQENNEDKATKEFYRLFGLKYDELLKNSNTSIKQYFQPIMDMEYSKAYLLFKAIENRNLLSEKHSSHIFPEILSIVSEACEFFIHAWSNINPENRGTIVSTMAPFFGPFLTPELMRVFSPQSPSFNIDNSVREGNIVIPSFPSTIVGDAMANAIITLIKGRWQDAVLSLPKEYHQRPKIQILEEYQRIISFGMGGQTRGDGEYFELARGFGGMALAVTQGFSALKAKAEKDAHWTKLLTNLRSILVMGTTDPETIQLLQNLAGKRTVKKTSKTMSENGGKSKFNVLEGKNSSTESNMSVSYQESEVMEERVQMSELVEAEGYSGYAIIFDGVKNKFMKVAFRPSYWPEKRDRFEVLKRAKFNPKDRELFVRRKYKDSLSSFYSSHKK